MKTVLIGIKRRMRYKILFRIVISVIFLSYLIFEINWSSLIETFSFIQPEYFLISLLVALLNPFVLAKKYHVLMEPTGLYQPFLRLVKINFISRFYAMFLSTAVGHGIVRWHRVTKNQDGRSRFITVMVLERLTFLIAIVCTTILSLTLLKTPGQIAIVDKMLPLLWLCSGCLIFSLFFFIPPLHQLLKRWLIWTTARLPSMIQRYAGSFDLFVPYGYERILLTIIFAFIWQMIFLVRVYALFLSLQVPLSILDVTWMASLVLLLQVIPVSFSGIGIRETAYAYLFKIQNLPPEGGALIGILFFTQMLMMSFIGGALELFSRDE